MRAWMTNTEVSEALGVSDRHAQRLARAYRIGVELIYVNGRAQYRQRYDRDAVMQLARARVSNRCAVCGSPARPSAYTCGDNACRCKAYKVRARAYSTGQA